jgi:hypothetical protein
MKTLLLIVAISASASISFAQQDNASHVHHEHPGEVSSPLTEPGNDAFAAMQEVVAKLMADPMTDWGRVNL